MYNLIFSNENLINTVILKNAQSTIASVYLDKYYNFKYKDHNSDNPDNDYSWWYLYSKFEQDEHKIDILQLVKYKKFVIYRDPFDRFLSLYKDMKLKDTNHLHLQKLGLTTSLSDSNFVDKYIEISNNNLDEHCMKQCLFYRNVDIIVPINKLNKFITNELQYNKQPKLNSTDKLPESEYTNMYKYKNKIKEHFKLDYEIINEHKNIIYK